MPDMPIGSLQYERGCTIVNEPVNIRSGWVYVRVHEPIGAFMKQLSIQLIAVCLVNWAHATYLSKSTHFIITHHLANNSDVPTQPITRGTHTHISNQLSD